MEIRAVQLPRCVARFGAGLRPKSRHRDGTAGLPSRTDIFDECRHGR